MIKRLWKTRILKFAVVGGSGAVLGLGILYVLTSLCRVNYLASNVVAFVISVTSNYVFNTKWTFRNRLDIKAYLKYVATSLTTFGINELILWSLTSTGLYYMLASVIAILVAFVFNWILSRRYVWQHQNESSSQA